MSFQGGPWHTVHVQKNIFPLLVNLSSNLLLRYTQKLGVPQTWGVGVFSILYAGWLWQVFFLSFFHMTMVTCPLQNHKVNIHLVIVNITSYKTVRPQITLHAWVYPVGALCQASCFSPKSLLFTKLTALRTGIRLQPAYYWALNLDFSGFHYLQDPSEHTGSDFRSKYTVFSLRPH